jgi:glycerol uptake facilitator-like aquaporin
MSHHPGRCTICGAVLSIIIGSCALISGIVILVNYFEHKQESYPWPLWVGLLNIACGFTVTLTTVHYGPGTPARSSGPQIALVQLPSEAIAPLLPAVGPAPMFSPTPSAPYYYSRVEDSTANVV